MIEGEGEGEGETGAETITKTGASTATVKVEAGAGATASPAQAPASVCVRDEGDEGDEGVAGRRRGGTSTGEGTLLMLDIEQDRRLSNVDSVVVSVKDPMLAAQSLSCPDRR